MTARWNWPKWRQCIPGIECVLFPKNDYPAGLAMLRRLRDLVRQGTGFRRTTHCDLKSIRQGVGVPGAGRRSGHSGKLSGAGRGSIDALILAAAAEPRVLELVNKTNQFNLNGRRYTEADWRKLDVCSRAQWWCRSTMKTSLDH